jgi:hypothetical protein
MGNLYALVFVAGACWLALLMYLVGALLRKVDASRALGETIHTFAFSLYVLGGGITALFLMTQLGDNDFVDALKGAALIVGFPILVCSIQFFRLAQQRKRAA